MADRSNDLFGRLRDRAIRSVAYNAAALGRLAHPGRSPLVGAALTAKGAHDIYRDEEARSAREARAAGLPNAHNNGPDAMRHARASARLTRWLGPELASAAGTLVEIPRLAESAVRNARQLMSDDGGADGPPPLLRAFSESAMDLRNNAEGRAAALEGRAIDPRRLQERPGVTAEYEFLYDRPPAGRTGVPPR